MIGKKLTIFSINVRTVKRLLTIVNFDKPSEKFIYKEKGKRNKYYLSNFSKNDLVFEGWEIPIHIDIDVSNFMRMNACMSLVGDAKVIKDYIENHNLNENYEPNSRGEIILIDPEKGQNAEDQESLLYPEIHSHHAVIQNLKNNK